MAAAAFVVAVSEGIWIALFVFALLTLLTVSTAIVLYVIRSARRRRDEEAERADRLAGPGHHIPH